MDANLKRKHVKMKEKCSLFLLICFFFSLGIHAQFQFDFQREISVKVGTKTMAFPWAGGLNNVQPSQLDFDFDGDLDLVIFDRSHDNMRLFEHIQTNGISSYQFVPNAARFFPTEIRYRVTCLDYDNDGKNDLFTYGIGGLKVYKNTGSLSTGIQWQLVKDIVYSDYNGDYTNLYVASSDIPAIIDVDQDGDLDVLTFHISGQHLEYHQNQSQELYGHSDSLVFVLKNECWGKFKEDANTNALVLNDPDSPCVNGSISNPEMPLLETENREERHAGSTVLALDYTNSGVLDLVLGDVAYPNLSLLINGGTSVNSDSPMVSQDNNFPSNTTPAQIQLFPASFYLDVDFDGIKDLIVGANARGVSQNQNSVYFYKNVGGNSSPNFQFKTKSFLQEDMIDAGYGSIPIFFDANNDGLEDLIVGNFYRYKEVLEKESNLQLYRNTGSTSAPEFTYLQGDYLNLTSQNLGLYSAPTFGDLDGDGDKDMFIGLENGTLVYYQNLANSGQPAQFSNPVPNYVDDQNQVITAGSFCFPQLFDLNEDGLLDLILGKKTGELLFYKNTGTSSNPVFILANSSLGNVDVSTDTPEGFAAPFFFKNGGEIYLMLGAFDGKIHFYQDIANNLEPGSSFELISDAFLGINVEAYSKVWVNDIDNDGKLDLFVGGDLGGIFHLEHDPNSNLGFEELQLEIPFQLYPNPAQQELTLLIHDETISSATWNILNLQGKVVQTGMCTSKQTKIDVSQFNSGVYFIRLQTDAGAWAGKFVKN